LKLLSSLCHDSNHTKKVLLINQHMLHNLINIIHANFVACSLKWKWISYVCCSWNVKGMWWLMVNLDTMNFLWFCSKLMVTCTVSFFLSHSDFLLCVYFRKLIQLMCALNCDLLKILWRVSTICIGVLVFHLACQTGLLEIQFFSHSCPGINFASH